MAKHYLKFFDKTLMEVAHMLPRQNLTFDGEGSLNSGIQFPFGLMGITNTY